MNTADAVEVSPETIKGRLGVYATGGGRDVKAAAALAVGERLQAAVVAMWERRAWTVVAPDAGLRLARRPLLFGRPRAHAFGWHEPMSRRARSGQLSHSVRVRSRCC